MEDKFLTYSSITLAGEESFVRLIRHRENESIWKAWLEVHPDMQRTVEEAKRIVVSLDNIPQSKITAEDKKQLWQAISSSLQTTSAKPPRSPIRDLWRWGLAAAASLAILFWFGSEAGKNKVYAEAGQHLEVVLPEKSIVSLNAGSHLIYKEKTFDQDRILHLHGEAFFKVEPGSTFTVLTDEGTVTVVGTSFNVLAREGRFEVSCYTGKVRVERNVENQAMLTTGQKTSTTHNHTMLETTPFNASTGKPEWTEGKFHFEDQPLSTVVGELERQYDVRVVLADGLDELRYTGLFESGDLAEALQLITWPLHLKSSVKGKIITITR
jgi:ferric-dicitrate binding protein FerR (iron transport regulator)